MAQTRTTVVSALFALLLVVIGAVFAAPFVWMVLTSLQSLQQVFHFPPSLLPHVWEWINYPRALTTIPLRTYFRNSVTIAALSTVGTLFCASTVGYSLSLVRWPGRTALLWTVLATMMLPFAVKMIPLFLLYMKLHWVGGFAPLIVPSYIDVPYFIFLMRQFYLTLPRELAEAARVDGAGELRIFWSVILPLTRPALATVAIFSFLFHWNDFMGPLIYLTHPRTFTLALGLQAFQNTHSTQWTYLMAAATVFTLPVILLFAFGQRYFTQGIAITGIKG